MITKNNFFQSFLLLSIQFLLSLRPIIGQHSSELESASQIRCLDKERQALLMFKEEIVDEYGRLSTWGIGETKRDCCKWRGVHCHNRTNHVTRLDLRAPSEDGFLSSTPLKGTISPSLLELHHLNYLDLSFNEFDVAFPEFIGSLSKLQYLNLSNTNFYGPIPHRLGNLSQLLYLDLNDINCHSENLNWISHLHSLEYLDLSYVNLSNAANWLQAISKLTSTKELHLTQCDLPNILPSSLPSINASTPLEILGLQGSQVSSSFIQWWSNFSSSLNYIDLSESILRDPIPDAFENMVSLAYLDLSYIQIEGTGEIPQSFGNISSLVHLNLAGNNLTGQLSELITNLFGPWENKLEYLDLSCNNISGSLPDFSRFSFLIELILGGNKLNGIIYDGFLRLPNLVSLNLGENQFTGPVPDLSFSSSLKELYLYNNMFNGTLSESIGRLSKLEFFSLYSNKLEGIITETHLLNLSRLQLLDFSFNTFLTVKINPFWVPPFQLKYLSLAQCKVGKHFPNWLRTQKEVSFLDISDANIVDTFPSWFGEITHNLAYLNASNNEMYGVISNISISAHKLRVLLDSSPYMLIAGTKVMLDLSRNKISGSVSFLCNSTRWSVIDLSDNLFSNQLPDCFSKFEILESLNLANNNLRGKIPNSFGSIRGLALLYLQNNKFSGEIPTSMSNCTKLWVIDLGKNKLTGKIPTWIGHNISSLGVLRLRFNGFSGCIPLNLCGLPYIQVLDLSSNKISGVVPKCLKNLTVMSKQGTFGIPFFKPAFRHGPISFGKFGVAALVLITGMSSSPESLNLMWKGSEVNYTNSMGLLFNLIDLSNNTLSGEIPDEITKLIGLNALNFSSNNLSGPIPQNIGELKYLEFLDFSRNHLSGGIPTSLFELSFKLNLSYNNLSGKVPPNAKFDESAYLGNSGLCGREILNKSCPGDDETPPVSNSSGGGNATKNLEHEDDEFITKGFFICMEFGFIVGFWGIVGTVLLNKSFRYAFFKMVSNIEDYIYISVVINKARLQRYFTNQ